MEYATILVVEDESFIAENVCGILEDRGNYRALAVSSGEEALAKAAELKPSLVLMDIVLAGSMNGIETAGLLQKSCESAIVYCTAHGDKETLDKLLRTAPYGYILKPFSDIELISAVESALLRRRREVRIEENERRYRELVESTPVLLIRWRPDSTITFANSTYCAYYGTNEEALKGYRFLSHVPESDREIIYKALAVMREERRPVITEYRVILPGGRVRFNRWTNLPHFDESGALKEVQSFGEDITDQRQTVRGLRQSTRALRALVDANPESMLLIDAEGVVIAANRAAAGRLKLEITRLVGSRLFDAFPPEAAAEWKGRVDETVRQKTPCTYIDRKEGCVLEHRLRPICDPSGAVTQLSIMSLDVTARNALESKLIIEQQKRDNIIDLNPFPIMVTDVEGRPVRINQEWMRMSYGIAPPMDYSIFTDKRFLREGIIPRLLKVKEGETVVIPEFWYNSGELRPGLPDRDVCERLVIFPIFNAERKIENIVLIRQDITDLKNTELALRVSEERYRSVIDNIDEYIYSYSFDRGAMVETYHSPRCREITGYSPEEVRADPRLWWKAIHPDDRKLILELYNQLMKNANPPPLEHRILRKDGSVRWVSNNCTAQIDAEGNILRIIGFIIDITERRAMEEELKKAKESADAASRAKSQFLSNMSHELRTPLNSVLGFCQLIESRLRGRERDEDFSSYISYIRQGGEHLLEMVNDILDLSKIEAGRLALNKKPVDLYRVLSASASTVGTMAMNKELSMSLEIDQNLGLIEVDEVRIKQVVFNLLSNAIKFTERGKRFGIQARADGGHAVICVWDEGPGIPDEFMDKIFKPFEQVRNTFSAPEGTGLGLSITRRLVEMHGGTLSVESELGRGSCFTVILPGRKPSEQQSEVEERRWPVSLSPEGGLRRRALVADDQHANLILLRAVLEGGGFEVSTASSGEEALEQTSSGAFDIIFMDVKMPGMGGVEAMKRIKGSLAERPPVVALTALAMKDDRDRLIAEGFDDYLSKPLKIELLIDVVRRLLG